MKKYLGLFLALLLMACSSDEKPAVSFYYWKTIYSLSAFEKQQLKENQVSKLYLRYFDIALKDRVAIPLMPIRFQEKVDDFTVVPVVYIKNEVMLDPEIQVAALAQRTLSMIDKINEVNRISVEEIQIDCDWTLKSREQFMAYIEALRRETTLKISATIRLHQIKYHRETGVPNVDRGVLMYYNMGRIDSDDLNSIYDAQTASKYIKSAAHYPLALDVALPIFGWGVHLRNHKVVGLIPKITDKQLQRDVKTQALGKHRFEVTEDIIAYGTYLRAGDQIKMEAVTKADLQEMVSELRKQLQVVPREIIYYDLDSINLKTYSDEKEFYKKINSGF
ncbi:hypothetical protein [Flavobacterium sp. JP2137]|uniref:hypothetical protein n=1 Tax=Flavobacterium sp. JP2137 TaxID=3414510 RepID=UPI003D2FEC7F